LVNLDYAIAEFLRPLQETAAFYTDPASWRCVYRQHG
jgi:hypothetical protein